MMIKDIPIVAPEIREEAIALLTNTLAAEIRERTRYPEIAFAVAVQILDDLGLPIDSLLRDYDLRLRDEQWRLLRQDEAVAHEEYFTDTESQSDEES